MNETHLFAIGFSVSLLAAVALFLRRKTISEILSPPDDYQVVKWNGLTVLGALLLFSLFPLIVVGIVQDVTARMNYEWIEVVSKAEVAEITAAFPEVTKQHSLVLLMLTKNPFVLATCFFIAVIVAPFYEEFFYRLILTGWFTRAEFFIRREKREGSQFLSASSSENPSHLVAPASFPRRHFPLLGLMPVLLSSLFFALLHSRSDTPLQDVNAFFWTAFLYACVTPICVVLVALWMRFHHKMTLQDFGIVTSRIRQDIATGVLVFLMIAAPLYLLQAGSNLLCEYLSKNAGISITPDVISLVFFAILLGWFYVRTQRIVTSITLHVCLNLSSFLLLFA